jgi:hypothetical protein
MAMASWAAEGLPTVMHTSDTGYDFMLCCEETHAALLVVLIPLCMEVSVQNGVMHVTELCGKLSLLTLMWKLNPPSGLVQP